MPHQRLHRGKEARAGGEILPFRCGDFSGGAFHPCRLHVKEIPLHQEMVSVTGSVTWISNSSSVIDKNPDPRRQQDEKHARRYRPERAAGSVRRTGMDDERRCRSPSRVLAKGRIHRYTDRWGKLTESEGAGENEMEHPVGSESSRMAFSRSG